MNSLKKIYALNGVYIFVLMLAQLAVVPIYLHYLGIQVYEDWIFINAMAGVFQLLDFGLIFYVSNTARIAYGKGKPNVAEHAIRMGLSFWWILFACFGIISILFGIFSQTTRGIALAILVFSVPLSMLRYWLSYILTARTSQIGELISFILFSLLQTVSLLCVSLLLGNILALSLTMMISTVVFGVIPLMIAIHHYAPDLKLKPRKVNINELKEIISGSLTNFSYSAASIAITQLPIILLGLVPNLPPASLATFTISRTLTGIVRMLCNKFAHSNAIEISRYLAPENGQKMRRIFLLGSSTIAILVAVGMGGLLPLADIVLNIWTGKPELYNPTVIGIFCVLSVLSAQLLLPMILPQFTNKARIMTMPLFLQVSLLVVLGLVGSYLYGTPGMVVALGVAELSTVGVVSLRRIIPQMGVSRLRFLYLSGGSSLCIFVVSFVASSLVRHFVNPTDLPELALSGGIWAIFVSPFVGLIYRWVTQLKWSEGSQFVTMTEN